MSPPALLTDAQVLGPALAQPALAQPASAPALLTDAQVLGPAVAPAPGPGRFVDPAGMLSEQDVTGTPTYVPPPGGMAGMFVQHFNAAAGQEIADARTTLGGNAFNPAVNTAPQALGADPSTPTTFFGGGWRSPNYLAARAGDIAGANLPSLVAAGTGAELGAPLGPLGMLAGGALGGATQAIPAVSRYFREATAPDAGMASAPLAEKQALERAAVSGVVGGAFGGMGGIGKLFESSIVKDGGQIVVRPPMIPVGNATTEALAGPLGQAVVVGPTIGAAGQRADDAITGHKSTDGELAEGAIGNALTGLLFHAALGGRNPDAKYRSEPLGPEPSTPVEPGQPAIEGAQVPEPSAPLAITTQAPPATPASAPVRESPIGPPGVSQPVAPGAAPGINGAAPIPAQEPIHDASPATPAPTPAPAGTLLTDADVLEGSGSAGAAGNPAPAAVENERAEPGAEPADTAGPAPGNPPGDGGGTAGAVAPAVGGSATGRSDPGDAGAAALGIGTTPGNVPVPVPAPEAQAGQDSGTGGQVAPDVAPGGVGVDGPGVPDAVPAPDAPGNAVGGEAGPVGVSGSDDLVAPAGTRDGAAVDGDTPGGASNDAALGQALDRGGLGLPQARDATGPNGKVETITTTTGRKVQVRHEVVDAATLKAATGDLQPRDRTGRAASEAQINDIAANPDFARLGSAPSGVDGAPIVDHDGTVLSGNGRAQAIGRAHQRGTAGGYVRDMQAAGYDTTGVERPTLVRRLAQPMDDVTKRAFVNEHTTQAMKMSPAEQAAADGRKLTPDLLAHYDPDLTGGPTAAGNQEFARRWMDTIPEAERNELMTDDGSLAAAGVRRLQGAMLARAYGDKGTLARTMESTDDNTKAVTGAMTDAAPAWANLRSRIEAGEVPGRFDAAPALVQANQLISQARDRGQAPSSIVAQQDAFNPLDPLVEQFVRAFHNDKLTRSLSRPVMADVLRRYATEAEKQSTAPGLFGSDDEVTPLDVMRAVRAAVARDNAEPAPAQTNDPLRDAPRAAPAALSKTSSFEGSIAEVSALGNKLRQIRATKTAIANLKAGISLRASGSLTVKGDDASDRKKIAQKEALLAKLEGAAPPPEMDAYDPNVKGSVDQGRLKVNAPSPFARQTYAALGFKDPDGMTSAPAEAQINLLKAKVVSSYGLAGIDVHPGANPRVVLDQLLDAHHGIQGMAAAMGLPPEAMGFKGTLRIWLGPEDAPVLKGAAGGYRRDVNTIYMPGRNAVFAHEWTHALDSRLARMVSGPGKTQLLSRTPQEWASAQADTTPGAFAQLMSALYGKDQKSALDLFRAKADNAQASNPATRAELARALSAFEASDFLKQARGVGGKQADYLSDPGEMLARSHEAYLSNVMSTQDPDRWRGFVGESERNYLNRADPDIAAWYPNADDRAAQFLAWTNLHAQLRADVIHPHGMPAQPPANDVGGLGPTHQRAWTGGTVPKAILDAEAAAANRQVNLTSAFVKTMRAAGMNDGAGEDPGYLTRWQRIMDGPAVATYTPRGIMQRIIARVPETHRAPLQGLLEHLTVEPGTGNLALRTYEDDAHLGTVKNNNQYAKLAERNGLSVLASTKAAEPMTREEQVQLHRAMTYRGAMTGLPEKTQEAARTGTLHRLPQKAQEEFADHFMQALPKDIPEHIRRFAGDLRFMLDERHYELGAAGYPVPYVDGYFPRKMNDAAVYSTQGSAKFLAAATEAMKIKARTNVEQGGTGADLTSLFSQVKAGMANPDVDRLEKTIQANRTRFNQVQAAILRGDPHADLAEAEARDLLPAAADRDLIYSAYGAAAATRWRKEILNGEPTAFDTRGPAGDFLQARTMPPEADDILRDFYHLDPHYIMPAYNLAVNRKVAFAKRFGTDGSGIDRAIDAAVDDGRGMRAEDARLFRNMVEAVTGRVSTANFPRPFLNMLEATRTLATMSMMPRSVFSGLMEPVTMFARTGDAHATLTQFAHMGRELFRKGDTRDVAELAEFMGTVSHAAFDTIQMERNGGTYSDTISLSPMAARYYRTNLLSQLTNAQRRAAVAGGFRWQQRLATTILKKGENAVLSPIRRLADAQAELRGLGIPDVDQEDYAKWILGFSSVPRISDIDGTRNGDYFSTASNRLTNQVNQAPRTSETPYLSANPLFKAVFSMMGFQYSFFANIVERYAAKVHRQLHEETTAGGKAFVTAAAVLRTLPAWIALWGASLMSTVIREFVFNGTTWDEHADDGSLASWLLGLSFDRIGLNGPLDPVVQMMDGLRYMKSMADMVVGAPVSYFANAGDACLNAGLTVAGLGGRTSPNTNTTYYDGVKGCFNLAAVPMIAYGMTFVGHTPMTRGLASVGLMEGTSPGMADLLARTLVGPKGATDPVDDPEKTGDTGQGGDNNAAANTKTPDQGGMLDKLGGLADDALIQGGSLLGKIPKVGKIALGVAAGGAAAKAIYDETSRFTNPPKKASE